MMNLQLRRRIRVLLIGGVFVVVAQRCAAAEPQRDTQMLFEPAQLRRELNDPDLRILDTRSPSDYREGHIRGAVSVDMGDWKQLAAADGGLNDTDRWAEQVAALGISSNSRVVVYGNRLSDAARVWWLLKYVGLENTSLLNGGWDGWVAADHPVEKTAPETASTRFHPRFQSDRLSQIDSLKDSIGSEGLRVVDTRSDSEFAEGRIPGAAHLEWTELVDKNGRFKSKTQLQELFRRRGIVPDETAVCY